MHTFNERRGSFSYDHSAKPPFIKEDHIKEGKLKLNMSEMLNMILALPLLVGDKVQHDDEMWMLFLSFRDMTLYILSPMFTPEELPFFRYLIANFLRQYSDLTSGNITIKFHLLTHYHYIIRQVGPIVHLMALRLEGKHRILKQFASSGNNLKNICLTIAKRHQLSFASRCLRKESMVTFDINPEGYCRVVSLSLHEMGSFITQNLKASLDESIEVIKRITINKVSFIINSVVVVGHSKVHSIPKFMKIDHIFRYKLKFLFICSKLIVEQYHEHFQAYEVCVTSDRSIMYSSMFLSPWPLVLRKLRTGEHVVSLRHLL